MENNKLSIIGAILLAGVLIAGAIIYTGKAPAGNEVAAINPPANEQNNQDRAGNEVKNLELKADDHILGNPNATLTLFLYSDIECPYCKRFHETMKQVMDAYGKDGKIKWVYRQFPLEQLHPTARIEAEATECVAELGGNEKFWQFLDDLSANSIAKKDPPAELAQMAGKYVGQEKFKTCLSSGKYKQKIDASIQEAVSLGARGTPFSIIVSPGNQQTQVPGALPYEQMKAMIDQQLAK